MKSRETFKIKQAPQALVLVQEKLNQVQAYYSLKIRILMKLATVRKTQVKRRTLLVANETDDD